MAGKVNEFERLKQENKLMRIELQQIKTPALTDGFSKPSRLAIEDDNSQIGSKTDNGRQESPSKFFMTEMGDFPSSSKAET